MPRSRPTPRRACFVLSAALLLTTGEARAISSGCELTAQEGANVRSPLGLARQPIATDAHPWFYGRCAAPERPFDCALIAEDAGDVVPVSLNDLAQICEDDALRLLRLAPARPLLPDRFYTLECASTPILSEWLYLSDDPVGVQTRPSLAPSLPPPPLAGLGAILRRQDDTGCCTDDPLRTELQLPLDAPELDAFLADGGALEVRFARGGDPWIYIEDSVLPWVEGDIVVTPVAGNSVRGAPFTITEGTIREELIYIPCQIARGRGALGCWLALPLLWLLWGTRRRRGGAA
jgi:hypothetical protein